MVRSMWEGSLVPKLKTFAQLGSTHRCDPCQEFPGTWYVCLNGRDNSKHLSYEAAYEQAVKLCNYKDFEGTISISWEASDNDPRIGEVWFTGFYIHTKFDSFGRVL